MVLKPMHRVEYELLGNEVNLLKKEINPIKKAEGMVNQVESSFKDVIKIMIYLKIHL